MLSENALHTSNAPETQGFSMADCRQLISKIGGVLHANLVLDEQQENMEEIHILADNSRSAKQIVRDVQSAIIARYDMKIDHRIISVAQIDAVSPQSHPAPFRLDCREISTTQNRSVNEITVTLGYGEDNYVGSSSWPASSYGILMGAAQATIAAVHAYLENNNLFFVSDVRNLLIGGQDSVVTSVLLKNKDSSELLLGAAINKGDIHMAVVKATLDAINRKLSVLTK